MKKYTKCKRKNTAPKSQPSVAENKLVAMVAVRESELALLAKLEGFLAKRISDALVLALDDVTEVV
jgi:hypothetical protein